MKYYTITVNGNTYEVSVEENTGVSSGAPASVAAPAPTPVPKAPVQKAAPAPLLPRQRQPLVLKAI